MVDLLAQDGITLDVTNKYGQGLLQTQKNEFRSAHWPQLPDHAQAGRARRIWHVLQLV